jgi:hypothetical protein
VGTKVLDSDLTVVEDSIFVHDDRMKSSFVRGRNRSPQVGMAEFVSDGKF